MSDASRAAERKGRPRRSRGQHTAGSDPPRWPPGWAVLAVVLALMALVAAVSRTPDPQRLPDARTARRSGAGGSAVNGGPPSGPTGRAPVTGVSTLGGVDPGSTPRQTAPSPRETTAGSSAPSSATTTPQPTPTATATVPTGNGTVSGPSTTVAPRPGPGNFEGVTRSSIWFVTGGGRVSARASWTGTPTLELSIACSDGPDTREEGTSPLAVTVTAPGHGSCQVVLSEPAPVGSPVSYSVVIDPPPSP